VGEKSVLSVKNLPKKRGKGKAGRLERKNYPAGGKKRKVEKKNKGATRFLSCARGFILKGRRSKRPKVIV